MVSECKHLTIKGETYSGQNICGDCGATIEFTNQERFKKFLESKGWIKEIAIPSSNPDNFDDLEIALEKIENDLRKALLNE